MMNRWVAPPRRALGLGLRLGLLTTIVVAGVMAVLSGAELALELQTELRERRAQLGESLAPLVSELKSVYTPEEMRTVVARFHASYVDEGHSYHYLTVADSTGRVIFGTRDERIHGPPSLLSTAVSFVCPALGPRPVALRITVDSYDFSAARGRRWRNWAVHVSVTALLIVVMLFFVIRREVTGPISRLLSGVQKMELGYWDDIPDPRGAWEVRWLGWRFRTIGHELSRTVELLVAAQRRAYGMAQASGTESETAEADSPSIPALPVDHASGNAIAWLRAQVGRLQGADPLDVGARSLALAILDRHADEAERLGQSELRLQLEDAAVRVLDPDEFVSIAGRIEAERHALHAFAQEREALIDRALARQGVPMAAISHRVKHAAGVWKKMRSKSLAFDQVHDLVALRIVVPTETDCYHALGTVHDLFVPIVGRFKDYIVQPKSNGYRGLHTSVRDPEGAVFEVQIRSVAMHRNAEHGSAAYAEYKHATRVPADAMREPVWKHLLRLVRGGRHRRARGEDATR